MLKDVVYSDFAKEVVDFAFRNPEPRVSSDWSPDPSWKGSAIFQAVPRIAAKHGQEILGRGSDRVVIPYPEDARKVIAIDYHRKFPVIAQMEYHSHRFFHKLFPTNIPRWYTIFGAEYGDWDRISGSIRQRIYPSSPFTRDQLESDPLADVISALRKMRADTWWFDLQHTGNFMNGENGNVYYVDDIHPNLMPRKGDASFVESFIEKSDLPTTNKELAFKSFNKFHEISDGIFQRSLRS